MSLMSTDTHWLGLISGPLFIVVGVLLVLAGVSMLGEGFRAFAAWILR
jgi:hypothetical protein